VGNGIYHVLNRGNCRMDLFEKTGDFAAFVKLLEQGRQRTGMRVLGYCLMHNHWHLALWPRRGPDLSRFMGWVGTTHVRRWREHRGNRGEGHLYQGRFKDFLVKDDEHLLAVLRYVEANPLRAGMVRRAEQWPWSSLGGRAGADGVSLRLEPWPMPRPRDWPQRVNRPLPDDQLDRLRTSIRRGRPFGDDKWVAATAAKLGLLSTLRDPWRPTRRDKRGTPAKQK
jgi:putative transposase